MQEIFLFLGFKLYNSSKHVAFNVIKLFHDKDQFSTPIEPCQKLKILKSHKNTGCA